MAALFSARRDSWTGIYCRSSALESHQDYPLLATVPLIQNRGIDFPEGSGLVSLPTLRSRLGKDFKARLDDLIGERLIFQICINLPCAKIGAKPFLQYPEKYSVLFFVEHVA